MKDEKMLTTTQIGLGCIGKAWNGVEWGGVEWSEVEWSGEGWRCGGVGWEGRRREAKTLILS